jgi:hypothetical protein
MVRRGIASQGDCVAGDERNGTGHVPPVSRYELRDLILGMEERTWASRHIFSNLARISVLAVPSRRRESGARSTA